MSKTKYGECAFQTQEYRVSGSRGEVPSSSDMTLRDYFAAAVLAQLVGWHGNAKDLADRAYEIADAMLAAREAKR